MKKNKIRIGINGLGRIGRHIFRMAALDDDIEIILINEKIADINNWIYTISYDTIYGKFDAEMSIDNHFLIVAGEKIRTSNKSIISDVPWHKYGVDYIIDCSGIKENVNKSRLIIDTTSVKKIFISHSPQEVDFTLVLGVNEDLYDNNSHHLIASSICDATAIAPITKLINDNFKIISGYVTTLHPWLSYQNLMDGPSSSWSVPGEIYHHYALGRSSIGNLIPKPTTAVEAVLKVIPKLKKEKIGSFSYRTPTQIVGSADLTFFVEKQVTFSEISNIFKDFEKNQKFPVLKLSKEPLVSLDFVGETFSCVLDERWLNIIDNNLIKCVLWYDNEFGYASNVIRQLKLIHSMSN